MVTDYDKTICFQSIISDIFVFYMHNLGDIPPIISCLYPCKSFLTDLLQVKLCVCSCISQTISKYNCIFQMGFQLFILKTRRKMITI